MRRLPLALIPCLLAPCLFAFGCDKASADTARPVDPTGSPDAMAATEPAEPEPEPVPETVDVTYRRIISANETELAGLAHFVSEDATYRFADGDAVEGRAAVHEGLMQSNHIFTIRPKKAFVFSPESAVFVANATGTYDKPWFGSDTPNGKAVGSDALVFVEGQGGVIGEIRVYVNQASAFAQAGLIEDVPASPVVPVFDGQEEVITGEPNADAEKLVAELATALVAAKKKDIVARMGDEATIAGHAFGLPEKVKTSEWVATYVKEVKKGPKFTLEPKQVRSLGEWVLWEGTSTMTPKKGEPTTRSLAVAVRVVDGKAVEMHRFENMISVAKPQLDALMNAGAQPPAETPADAPAEGEPAAAPNP